MPHNVSHHSDPHDRLRLEPTQDDPYYREYLETGRAPKHPDAVHFYEAEGILEIGTPVTDSGVTQAEVAKKGLFALLRRFGSHRSEIPLTGTGAREYHRRTQIEKRTMPIDKN